MKKTNMFGLGFTLGIILFTGTVFAQEMNDSNVSAKVTAIAQINSTRDSDKALGNVLLMETENGLMVSGIVSGVTSPGEHGIHIHQNGSCDDEGKAAGGHFNPDAVQHGFLPKDGYNNAHVGDMGNILITKDGSGAMGVLLPGVYLSEGKYNVEGKAIILHAKKDDFGQPTGNAGARIGCGIITLITK